MEIQIKNRFNRVVFETDTKNLGAAIVAALAAKVDLNGADLTGAILNGAILRGAYLNGAILNGADLNGAILTGAYLRGAILIGADLTGAYLTSAYLRGAILNSTDLTGADLTGAYLNGADLTGAILTGADLTGVDLTGAILTGAILTGADLSKLLSSHNILPDGDLVAWKQLQGGVICKLKIPADAKRVGGLVGRKCRAEFADVLEGNGKSQRNGQEYKAGCRVTPDTYDSNPLVECSHGIHFFITRTEAENYQ